ncbi:hypothetical protein GCM10022250_30110 [Flavobacterium chungbukense]|uniref:Uncharacterized protein n=1 Tax=Flavobacterium chungbukense TaxID=877464 RepID=A0ABP7YGR1_9FLAO
MPAMQQAKYTVRAAVKGIRNQKTTDFFTYKKTSTVQTAEFFFIVKELTH